MLKVCQICLALLVFSITANSQIDECLCVKNGQIKK